MAATIRATKRSSSFPTLSVVLVAEELLEVVSLRMAYSLCLAMGLLRNVDGTEAISFGVCGSSQQFLRFSVAAFKVDDPLGTLRRNRGWAIGQGLGIERAHLLNLVAAWGLALACR